MADIEDTVTDLYVGAPAQAPARKGWRKMTWVIVLWSVLMGAITLISVGGASSVAAEEGYTTGGMIALVLVGWGAIWLAGFVALSLIWLMTRDRS
jgi:hypothetical protein